jgi:hypothetical protein
MICPERHLLRDFVFEVNDLLNQKAKCEDEGYRLAVLDIVGTLNSQLEAFDIDQSDFPKPLISAEQWFIEGSIK